MSDLPAVLPPVLVHVRLPLQLAIVALLVTGPDACSRDHLTAAAPPAALTARSPQSQAGTAGVVAPQPPVARATDAAGRGFEADVGGATPIASWDVQADGERFLTLAIHYDSVGGYGHPPAPEIHLVLNWLRELEASR
jgi:hypothetical protein